MGLSRGLADAANPGVEKVEINSQTGTTYTLTGSDNGKIVELDNAAAITVTVPLESSEDLGAGFNCVLVQKGAGLVTVAPEGAVSITSLNGTLDLGGQGGSATIYKSGTDAFVLAVGGGGGGGGAGQWEYVSTTTFADEANKTINITASDAPFMIVFDNLVHNGTKDTNDRLRLRFNADSSAVYKLARHSFDNNTDHSINDKSSGATGIDLCINMRGNGTDDHVSQTVAVVTIVAGKEPIVKSTEVWHDESTTEIGENRIIGCWQDKTVVTSLYLYSDGGYLVTGNVYLYKLVTS